ncbi:MAG: electron transfer flavoprotein subunit alpha/FixB family protein, partial [Dehalococcoidia bacterium]
VELCAVLLGDNVEAAAQELVYRGADTVYLCDSEALATFDIMNYRKNILAIAKQAQPEILLLGATPIGRSLGPRLAAALGTGLTADCTTLEIDEEHHLVQIRPAFSGNILAHIKTDTRPQMATVRYKIMQALERDCTREGRIIRVDVLLEDPLALLVKLPAEDEKRQSLSEAEIVICGGRGLRKPEDMALLHDLADAIGGVVGCSKPLVDEGWLDKEHLVGFSGNTVRPRLYLAIGVSGSSQHLIGMRAADTIVAINSDPTAPIFEVADFGMVGNLYDLVPRLTAAVRKSREADDTGVPVCG